MLCLYLNAFVPLWRLYQFRKDVLTMSMRTKIIAGNWKMNTTAIEAVDLVRGILEGVADVRGVEIVVCPPFTSLATVSMLLGESNVALGAQNMH